MHQTTTMIAIKSQHIAADINQRPKTVAGGVRSQVQGQQPELCIEIRSPLLLSRSSTSLAHLPALTSPRLRPKSTRVTMAGTPRSQVGVARFYDWSDDPGECLPMSRLYREIASIPRIPVGRKPVNGQPVSSGKNFPSSQGRLFVREKKALTKGEREIIEGICKNRGDSSARESLVKFEQLPIKSHLDAWHTDIGNNISLSRVWLKGERIETKTMKQNGGLADAARVSSPSPGSPGSKPQTAAKMRRGSGKHLPQFSEPLMISTCLTCQEIQDTYREGVRYTDLDPAAPPSSPDILYSRPLSRPTLTFDKLLSARSTFQPSSILLADRLAAMKLEYKQINLHVLNNVYSETSANPSIDFQIGARENFTSVAAPTNDEALPGTTEALIGTAQWVLQCEKRVPPHSEHNGHEKRKLEVQIYVPTAGPDQADDDAAATSSTPIKREKPHNPKKLPRKRK